MPSDADFAGVFLGRYVDNRYANNEAFARDYAVVNSDTGKGVVLISSQSNRIDSIGNTWSWLRTPNYDANAVCAVTSAGTLWRAFRTGTFGALRPAFWVDITSAE